MLKKICLCVLATLFEASSATGASFVTRFTRYASQDTLPTVRSISFGDVLSATADVNLEQITERRGQHPEKNNSNEQKNITNSVIEPGSLSARQLISLMQAQREKYKSLDSKLKAVSYRYRSDDRSDRWLWCSREIISRRSGDKTFSEARQTDYDSDGKEKKTWTRILAITNEYSKLLEQYPDRKTKAYIKHGRITESYHNFYDIYSAMWDLFAWPWESVNTEEAVVEYNQAGNLYIVKLKMGDGPKGPFVKLFADPSKDFIVVKKEFLKSDDTLLTTLECSNFRKVDGLWIPYKYSWFDPVVKSCAEYEVENVRVNEVLDETSFDFEFPEGVSAVEATEEPMKEGMTKEGFRTADGESIIAELTKSAGELLNLGRAVLIYADDNEDKCPDTLQQIKSYLPLQSDFQWLAKNVVYLGKGKTVKRITEEMVGKPISGTAEQVIAYDRSLMKKGDGTNVLFSTGLTLFRKPGQLRKLGITGDEEFNESSVPSSEPNITEDLKDRKLVVRIIDPNGIPVEGARIYKHFDVNEEGRQGPEFLKSGKDGLFEFGQKDIFESPYQPVRPIMLYALAGKELGGFLKIAPEDAGKEIKWQLGPVCRIFGRLESSELTKLGRPLDWTNVYLYKEYPKAEYRLLSYSSRKQQFEFLAPAGSYKLIAYGMSTYSVWRNIEVKAGDKELEVNLDLPADRLAYLVGKPAPELQKIKGWKNGGPVRLSELRGKVVLLDFWGYWCGPCIAEMPELMKLHDSYSSKGLVIIAVHDDRAKDVDSIEQLDSKLEKIRQERWNGHNLPFIVALDGGGQTAIEGTGRTVSGATTAAYGIQAWPTCVLIDKQGKVVGRVHIGTDKEKIEKLLSE